MFEKEARKWVKENTKIDYKASYGEFPIEPSATKSFAAGAEFGYNKADEWHNYSERPVKKINALCFDIKQNKFILGFYDLEADEWLRYGGYETIYIDLWKEIVLPELPERIKQDDR